MTDVAEIARRLSQKAASTVAGYWPRNSHTIHHAHIRWFNRHSLITQHNTTDYRLTPLGLAVRAHLLTQEPNQ